MVKTGFARMSVSKVDLILVCYVSNEGCVPDRMTRAVSLTEVRRDRRCLEWRCRRRTVGEKAIWKRKDVFVLVEDVSRGESVGHRKMRSEGRTDLGQDYV